MYCPKDSPEAHKKSAPTPNSEKSRFRTDLHLVSYYIISDNIMLSYVILYVKHVYIYIYIYIYTYIYVYVYVYIGEGGKLPDGQNF